MFQYYYASDGKVHFRKSDQATPEAWLAWRDCSPDKCVLTDSTDTGWGTRSPAGGRKWN